MHSYIFKFHLSSHVTISIAQAAQITLLMLLLSFCYIWI